MNSQGILRKLNLLAVDDYPANLVALKGIFVAEYNIHIANSGAEAISILEKRRDIDVILMDLQMPDMDGFETAARIKTMVDCQDIPIIFITSIYKEDHYIKKGYEVGGVDFFSKPFNTEILKMKVAVYASFHQKADVLKAREHQIRASEELHLAGRNLSSIFESLPAGVIIADSDGRIYQTNEIVSHIFKSVESTENASYGEILGWWDASGQMIKDKQAPVARALSGESSHNEFIQIRCFDGSSKTILGSASPLREVDGKIMGVVVVIQDVTELRKIKKDLEQIITKLVSLNT